MTGTDITVITCGSVVGGLLLWAFWATRPAPKYRPTVLKAGELPGPPTAWGDCDRCGCVFQAERQHCTLSLGSLHFPCPTPGCCNMVKMRDGDVPWERIRPRGGSAISPPSKE